ncbi:hypothetical protein [Thermogymnomonas acidicola]|uniref:hypothetical protein n=1 Tax=Thermogymnomonas acidicola TaxID=399579 RepID=UPI00094628D5|nr:hypothetical protein [Thermogymnomonas acidicola]
MAYVKSATPPRVNSDDDFSTFIEWSNRETALSISASSKIFTYGITFYISHLFLIAMAAVLSIYISPPAFVILLLPISITIARNCQRAGRRDPLFVLCNLLVLPVYTYNLVKGRLMKEIVWRGGRKYRLISPDFQ